uniref:Transmembrane protein 130 n=1 Tax=Capra hircus TaxID=9925 RepID=A0A8C2PJ18_CAPHI
SSSALNFLYGPTVTSIHDHWLSSLWGPNLGNTWSDDTAYNLTHIFRDPGDYCFSIQAENVISKAHQYHKVQVWPSSIQPAVFAFPCATLITMMLAFIMYMTLRNATHQKDMVENPEPPTGARCCCQMCCGPFLLETSSEYLEVVRENHRLLPPRYKSAKTYTV